jgi:hypothetical protein
MNMQLVKNPQQEGTYLQNFTVKDALKLNKIDAPNAIAAERALPRTAPIIRAVLPLPVQAPAAIPAVQNPVPVVENYIGK